MGFNELAVRQVLGPDREPDICVEISLVGEGVVRDGREKSIVPYSECFRFFRLLSFAFLFLLISFRGNVSIERNRS